MNTILKQYFAKKSPAATLVEFILWLMLALAVVATAGYAFNSASTNSNIMEMQSNLVILRSQINQVFSGSSSYDELDNDIAIKSGAVPVVFIKGDKLINQWGGDLTLASVDDGSAFTIEIDNIPDNVCTQLGTFQPDSWLSIKINGSVIEDGSVIDLTEACISDENTLLFMAR